MRVAALALLGSLAAAACRSSEARSSQANPDSTTLLARESRFQQKLAQPDSTPGQREEPVARWFLPPALAEISGLTLTDDGRLFAHNDETARVTELDFRRGSIVKEFFVGGPGMRSDFEAITTAHGHFYMLVSDGRIYEFKEGGEGERVEYTLHETKLGKECEFEGIAFDSVANALLLACKNVGTKKLKDFLVIYRWALSDSAAERLSTVTVPLAEIIGKHDWKELNPTDITVDPLSGNYVLVAAPQKAIFAITPAGQVVFSRELPGRHPQTEGVAISREGILIVSDEAIRLPAAITLYRWP